MKPISITKPQAATWRTAKLWDVNLNTVKTPICGQRRMWVIVGRKHVRFHNIIGSLKFRLSRADWDALTYKKECI